MYSNFISYLGFCLTEDQIHYRALCCLSYIVNIIPADALRDTCRHGNDQIIQNIPSLASKELIDWPQSSSELQWLKSVIGYQYNSTSIAVRVILYNSTSVIKYRFALLKHIWQIRAINVVLLYHNHCYLIEVCVAILCLNFETCW